MLNSQLKTSSFVMMLVGALFLAPTAEAQARADFATLSQMALNNSVEYKRWQADLEVSEAQYDLSKSTFWPKLGVETRFEKFDSDLIKQDGQTSSAFLDWNIFNGFKDYSFKQSRFFEKEQKQNEFDRFKLNLIWKIKKAYAKAYSTQETLNLYQEFGKKNQSFLQTVKARKASGLLSDSDFLEFEMFDSKLKFDTLSAEYEYQSALTDIKLLTGLEKIPVLTEPLPVEFIQWPTTDMKSLLSERKSKVYGYQLKVEEAEAQSRLAAAGYLPQISVKATYGSLGLRETADEPETTVGVVARWELFSGFETYNDRKAAQARLMKSQASLQEEKWRSVAELENLFNQLKNVRDRIEFEDKNKARVDQYLKTVTAEYKRGVKNAGDIKAALELALQTTTNRLKLAPEYIGLREKVQDILGFELASESVSKK